MPRAQCPTPCCDCRAFGYYRLSPDFRYWRSSDLTVGPSSVWCLLSSGSMLSWSLPLTPCPWSSIVVSGHRCGPRCHHRQILLSARRSFCSSNMDIRCAKKQFRVYARSAVQLRSRVTLFVMFCSIVVSVIAGEIWLVCVFLHIIITSVIINFSAADDAGVVVAATTSSLFSTFVSLRSVRLFELRRSPRRGSTRSSMRFFVMSRSDERRVATMR